MLAYPSGQRVLARGAEVGIVLPGVSDDAIACKVECQEIARDEEHRVTGVENPLVPAICGHPFKALSELHQTHAGVGLPMDPFQRIFPGIVVVLHHHSTPLIHELIKFPILALDKLLVQRERAGRVGEHWG